MACKRGKIFRKCDSVGTKRRFFNSCSGDLSHMLRITNQDCTVRGQDLTLVHSKRSGESADFLHVSIEIDSPVFMDTCVLSIQTYKDNYLN